MKLILLNIICLLLSFYSILNPPCEEMDNLTKCIYNKNYTKYPDFCCYFEPLNVNPNSKNQSFCKTVPYSSYFTGYHREYLNGTLFKVTCLDYQDQYRTFALEQCGNIYKKEKASLNKCKEFSTPVDSCCYYSGKKDESIDFGSQEFDKGCYWLGSKYEGKITWAGIDLECHQNYLNYYIFSLFTFLFRILLL